MHRSKRPQANPYAKGTLTVGQPGYRTRPGRSGYDPLETNLEAAHIVGVLLRKLLRGVLRRTLQRTILRTVLRLFAKIRARRP
jgi:hypothetical protein